MPLGYVCFVHFWKLSPRVDIPEVYRIDSTNLLLQRDLRVDALEAKVVYSKLGLFNWNSLIQYTISGAITLSAEDDKAWAPFIDTVHVSQRYLLPHGNHSSYHRPEVAEALVEFQPLVNRRGRKASDPEPMGKTSAFSFTFTNQMVITSIHFGVNIYRFQCGKHWVDLDLFQGK